MTPALILFLPLFGGRKSVWWQHFLFLFIIQTRGAIRGRQPPSDEKETLRVFYECIPKIMTVNSQQVRTVRTSYI